MQVTLTASPFCEPAREEPAAGLLNGHRPRTHSSVESSRLQGEAPETPSQAERSTWKKCEEPDAKSQPGHGAAGRPKSWRLLVTETGPRVRRRGWR
ncbi:hypothetical protein BN12_580003 [Nostocoides japonicum T1-X7]|uniref:Uncharacterized protein n=1 Tax=Nostocoides japonicum T1-X7 TaxID=1194083 RepID=A0A077M6I0_9MICO|nr:hypothetical protein BN12_580003 [Tetrasphaera japonica T1-X7]